MLAIQVGAVLRSQVLLVHLTRQVAREAAASFGEGEVDQGAAARAAGLDPARLDLEVAPAAGDGLVTVRAAYRQPLAVPLVGVVHRDVTLTAQLSIRAEEAEDAVSVLTITDSGLAAAVERPASPVWVDVPG